MAITIKGKAVVSAQHKSGGNVTSESLTEETVVLPAKLAAPIAATEQLCEVGFNANYTHNLGNYCSVKFGVSLRIPCLHGEIDDSYTYAEAWVDSRIGALKGELESST
jgi:hypothetical protein